MVHQRRASCAEANIKSSHSPASNGDHQSSSTSVNTNANPSGEAGGCTCAVLSLPLDSSHMQNKRWTNHAALPGPESGSANPLLFMSLRSSMIFSTERNHPAFPVIRQCSVSLPWGLFHDLRPLVYGGCKKISRTFSQSVSHCSWKCQVLLSWCEAKICASFWSLFRANPNAYS